MQILTKNENSITTVEVLNTEGKCIHSTEVADGQQVVATVAKAVWPEDIAVAEATEIGAEPEAPSGGEPGSGEERDGTSMAEGAEPDPA